MSENKRVVIIGGGPAGMMAANVAAVNSMDVLLLEKNTKLGKKMLISGKGRCNVTNDSDMASFLANMPGNGKFLYSAYKNFSAQAAKAWFEQNGVPLKTERGDRVFPESDISGDIVSCLERQLRRCGAKVEFLTAADGLYAKDGRVVGVKAGSRRFVADAVLVATGGLSYPLTGSTGDGYRLAKAAGHCVVPPFPSLVPLVVTEAYVKDLEGLSLRNVGVALYDGDKKLESRFGELVFTADGLSGPVILSASRAAALHFAEKESPLRLVLDLKPALSEKQLDERLQRDFDTYSKRSYLRLVEELLPKKLIPVFVKLSGLDPWKKGFEMNRQDRKTVLKLLKNFTFTVSACRPVEEAIVTAGGVKVNEVDPKTMMSKKLPGLFFAGEVLDIDGYTGGFNIQAALCSGRQAGAAMAAYCLKD